MNKIVLKGRIRNIEFSHNIGEVEYEKAELIVPREDGDEDVISLRFKKFSNPGYAQDDIVDLVGNIRSYSRKLENGKNKVDLYVFSYLDTPEASEDGKEIINEFEVDGRVCKLDKLRTTTNGKQNYHFILANNIISGDGKQKLNNYLACVAWGKLATEAAELNISDKVVCKGQLHSRTYKKTNTDGELEIHVAHELVITELQKVEEL